MKVKEISDMRKLRCVKFKSIEVGQCFCVNSALHVRMLPITTQLSSGKPYMKYNAVNLEDGVPCGFDDECVVTLVKTHLTYYKLLEHVEE